MNPISHLLLGWCVASADRRASLADRRWVAAAGVVPDLDGLGLVAEWATRDSPEPLYWWSEYHHRLAHNLTFGVVLTALAYALTRRVRTAVLVAVSFHLHLLADLVGSRGPDGYQWPIPYLWPLSDAAQLTVSWQWPLNAWQNLAITFALLCHAFWFAWARGSSPIELVSRSANRAFVETLRSRVRRAA